MRTPHAKQPALPMDHSSPEAADFLRRQLITYLGNKRALLGPISEAIAHVKRRLNREKLSCFDGFSGSGVVSRLLKGHAERLISNDLEDYAAVIGRAHLANRSAVDLIALQHCIDDLNGRVDTPSMAPGFIEELYAPQDEQHISADDRVFYTRENARRLDDFRRLIGAAPPEFHDLLLAPLLSAASIHANTAGVFKGFYKNRATKVGQFGGTGTDALKRILGRITLEMPVLSRFECSCAVWQQDANAAVRRLADMDLAYLDPPYNQHPYGSNYFMLNLLVRYERPTQISRVSGIPTDWQRSEYNVREKSLERLTDLVTHCAAKFLLVSFSNEGFIAPTALHNLLNTLGKVSVIEVAHAAFRGSRSFENRAVRVTEHLFLVERR